MVLAASSGSAAMRTHAVPVAIASGTPGDPFFPAAATLRGTVTTSSDERIGTQSTTRPLADYPETWPISSLEGDAQTPNLPVKEGSEFYSYTGET
jgi:hypothetical protein